MAENRRAAVRGKEFDGKVLGFKTVGDILGARLEFQGAGAGIRSKTENTLRTSPAPQFVPALSQLLCYES